MSRTVPESGRAAGRPERSGDSAVDADAHLEQLLDEALAATFPASDPVSTLTLAAPPRSTHGEA